MNVRLLRRIAKVIQEKPNEFEMGSWHKDTIASREGGYGWMGQADALCDIPKERQISCNTTHCIAGWAQALSSKRDCKVEAEEDAQRLLGLTDVECDRLFFIDGYYRSAGWPKKFRGRKDPWKPTAKQAAARIEHFIKTKGSE